MKKDESYDKMPLESEKQVPLFQDKPLCESLLDLQLTADEKKFLQQQSPGIFINYHNWFIIKKLISSIKNHYSLQLSRVPAKKGSFLRLLWFAVSIHSEWEAQSTL